MSELEDLIRDALREGEDPPDELSTGGLLVDSFLRRSRWVAAFAWMKMFGTLSISMVATIVFLSAESLQVQLASAACFVVGFVGIGMWWNWYFMMMNRSATLRELKRIELQLAELRHRGPEPGA